MRANVHDMHATTFARLDDEGELLEDAYLEVESSLDVLRASLHGADAASSPAEVDGHLATCVHACPDHHQHCCCSCSPLTRC